MQEWMEKHRTFEIGEKVWIPQTVRHRGMTGTIHSRDYPMNMYQVNFPDGSHVVISPFNIEPHEEEHG